MSKDRDRVLSDALKLPAANRAFIIERLLASLDPPPLTLIEGEDGFWEELDRRANDTSPTIPAAQLWPDET